MTSHPEATDGSRRMFLTAAAAAPTLLVLGGAVAAQTPAETEAQSSATCATGLPGAGRSAIVTGSSRGIGAATARRLAQDGFAVTVNYLTNQALAAEVVAGIEAAGGRAIVQQADVADPAAVQALFDAHDAAFGGVDVVISNAGIMNVGPFALTEDAAFDRMLATNVKGSFNVLREAARRVRDGGRIITLGSSIVRQPPPGAGAYAATKADQGIYAAVLSKELAGRNISVNAVSPGAVDTQLLRQHGEAALAGIPEATPLGRIGLPEDIAGVIAMFCAPDGAWITGQNIFANGGIA